MWSRICPKNGKDINRWERITNKQLVDKMLIGWQCQHFLQATETPFANASWREQLLDEDVQNSILAGTFVPPDDLPLEAREFLTFLVRDRRTKTEVTMDMEFKHFTDFVKKSDETTSCSPSGRKYSHHKTLHLNNSKIIQGLFDVFMLAVSNGSVLDRWCTTVTTLIEKDSGSPKIHRMRAIHIIECELQFLSKYIYIQKMMPQVEKLKNVTDEQYDGRNQRQAQSAVLNKIMYYDVTRQNKTPSAFMDDDARARYDHIVTPLSVAEGRKWGMSDAESIYTTKIIENQQFHVRTSNGITGDYYCFSPDTPIQGAGQGKGWAGPKWLNTSDTCSKILNDRCTGMRYQNPRGTIVIEKTADYFVDDTATGVNQDVIHDDTSVLEALANTEQKHAHVFFAAGHKLALDKCSFYVAGFKRNGTKFKYKRSSELPGDLHLQETFGPDTVKVPRLEPYQAHRTLGHFPAIDGNQKTHMSKIEEKMISWASKIKSSSLVGYDRVEAYHSYLEKACNICYHRQTSHINIANN